MKVFYLKLWYFFIAKIWVGKVADYISPYYKISLVMIGTEAFFDELRSVGIIE
jgi:hypothetical protein